MGIDNAETILTNVNKIEQFLNSVLEISRNKKEYIKLNPDRTPSIIYTEYINTLRSWRANHNTSDNPNPFFPKNNFSVKEYQKYHEVIMTILGEFIYDNLYKDNLQLKDLVNYLKDIDLTSDEYFAFFNNLSQLHKSYQLYILDQVTLATFENQKYDSTIVAFEQLFQNNPSYQGFSNYRLKDLNRPGVINYHKLMTQNISKEEIINLMNSRIKSFDANYEYHFVPSSEMFKKYVDELLLNYGSQILSELVLNLVNKKGVEEAFECINDYVLNDKPSKILKSKGKDQVLWRFLLQKYVKSQCVDGIIEYVLRKENIDIEGLYYDDIFSSYVSVISGGHTKEK